MQAALPLLRQPMTRTISMEKQSSFDLQMESVEGGLKELVLKWFTETQAPLIQNKGNFPEWFQGFATRRDTEDMLRDKALGSFLIRLSDKAIGYILSYKGHDRCRHFVITHNQDGQFIITGDRKPYHSLTELIEHYKVSPIQPFGEHLTSSCYEVKTSDLYDVVHFNKKDKSVSVQALRSLWDRKKDQPWERPSVQQQQGPSPGPPPSLPPKKQANNRQLMGTVSVDTTPPSQSVPPLPKRGFPFGSYLGGSLPETSTHPNETKIESKKKPNPSPKSRNSIHTVEPSVFSNSELIQVENRSKSLTELDNNTEEDEDEEEDEEEEEYPNQQSSTSLTASNSPSLGKRVTCQTYSLHEPLAQTRSSSSGEQQRNELEMLKSNPLYHTSVEQGKRSGQQAEAVQSDDTYEPIPGESTATVPGNMYESLEEMKSKKPKSTLGKSNIKWKKFLPDYMKK